MKFDIVATNHLIQNRRSIYPTMYSGEIIDEDIIHQMLENANWAPNHKLTEPWRFMVFTGEGIKKLAQFQSELYKEQTTADGSFDEKKYEKLKTKPLLSSHIISIAMKRNPVVPEVEEIGAVFSAAQNMQLTASAYGVGCYLSTGGITYYEAAKPFFDLGPEDKLLGFLHCGTPKTKWPQSKRKPIEDKVTWVDKA
ncbi:MAG: nitroreductase [Bacteroidota bacterium]